MKVYRLTGMSLESLQRLDEAVPTPRSHEILVRIRAASLNYKDLLFVKPRERGGLPLSQAFIPLSDASGEIVAGGAEVHRFAVGDRVAGINVQDWFFGPVPEDAPERALGYGVDGVLCEYRIFDQHNLLALPRHLTFEQGATLAIAGVTAWNALREVCSDETVMILGTGGVAIFALQFAKAAGARVLISTSSEIKAQKARALGADATINYWQHPDWDREVNDLTGGRGVDHVVDNVGGASLVKSVAAARIGGYIHAIGILDKNDFNPYQLHYKAITLRGIRMGGRDVFEQMNRVIERHQIVPVVDRVFNFDDARFAYEHLRSANHFGKVVIAVD
jgi:NADPH:quinone reductase-like Zn-dependent oxidoreductase